MAKKRVKRVHVECALPSSFREMKRLIAMGTPPIGRVDADGGISVLRPDRFERVLEATRCFVVETLNGAKRRRR